MPNFDEDDKAPNGCPFCGKFGCDHLLISIDESFRWASAGPLAHAFNARWSDLTEAGGDDFDETEPWFDLIAECQEYGYPDEYYGDSGPGTATNVLDLYCPTHDKVRDAVAALQLTWSEVGTDQD